MKRDERKRQKKRLKDQKKAAARRLTLAARANASLFPSIIIDPRGGDPEFISIVDRIAKEFDFGDPTICSPGHQRIFQHFHRLGFSQILKHVKTAVREGPQHGVSAEDIEAGVLDTILLYLGNWIFERLPEPCRLTPLPFHYFFVEPYSKDLVIRFAFLPSITSEHGRIYHSTRAPTVPFGGGRWKVGFFRHAIERICERICPSPQIGYAHFTACAIYFNDCIHFEPLELPDGQHAIRLFDYCDRGGSKEDDPYITKVLGLANYPGKSVPLVHVLGYCPVAFIGPRAVAKTFLYPGYRNTPEDHLVRTAPISETQRMDLLALASDNNSGRLYHGRGHEAIKWYHDNGVPQVLKIDRHISHLRQQTEGR